MKKLLALLAAVLMLLSCAAAMAETVYLTEESPFFDIALELPEGAAFTPLSTTGVAMADVQKEGMAHVFISVAFSELYTGDLKDITDEERDALIAAQTVDLGDVEVIPGVTPEGNMYVEFRPNTGNDLCAVWTLYQGYFVQLTLYNEDGQPLTEADHDLMMSLLYGMHFIPVGEQTN